MTSPETEAATEGFPYYGSPRGEAVVMPSQYQLIEGTEPDQDEQHEARTIVRIRKDDLHSMMTEIGDGTFVAWTQCARCNKTVQTCTCGNGGPTEPDYIKRWRVERFNKSFSDRGAEPALPVQIAERDRAKRAVMRALLAEGYQIIAPTPVPPQVQTLRAAEVVQAEPDGKIDDASTDEAAEEATDE